MAQIENFSFRKNILMRENILNTFTKQNPCISKKKKKETQKIHVYVINLNYCSNFLLQYSFTKFIFLFKYMKKEPKIRLFSVNFSLMWHSWYERMRSVTYYSKPKKEKFATEAYDFVLQSPRNISMYVIYDFFCFLFWDNMPFMICAYMP